MRSVSLALTLSRAMASISTGIILLTGIFTVLLPSVAISILLTEVSIGAHEHEQGTNNEEVLPLLLMTNIMRLVGGLLVGYGFHNLLLVFYSMGSIGIDSSSEQVKCDTQIRGRNVILIIHEIGSFALGLIVLVVGLASERGNNHGDGEGDGDGDGDGGTFHALILVAWGSMIVVMNCIALMASFYPSNYECGTGTVTGNGNGTNHDDGNYDPRENAEMEGATAIAHPDADADGVATDIDSDLRIGIGAEENDLQVPLLSGGLFENEDIEAHLHPHSYSHSDNDEHNDVTLGAGGTCTEVEEIASFCDDSDEHEHEHEHEHDSEDNHTCSGDDNDNGNGNGHDSNIKVNDEMDRITGTKRLIQLAGRQRFYLYAGCLVLLIRLPFSLSIPHFVSETIGALARAEYSIAKSNILYLFLFGTVDACLDFWCIFLFGLCNQKIVKSIRVDLFATMIRNEVAFFDTTKSGDLTSRLNSDCGEMAGDLAWFFRFSIESVVRIVGIVGYMMWRSARLGLCAISVVPIVAVINKRYGDWLNNNAKDVQNALAEANSVAQEAFSCIRTIIAFATEEYESNKYSDKVETYYELSVRQLYAQGFYYMLISTFLINTCVQSLLLYVGMRLMEEGELGAEVLLAFMLYQSGLQNEVMNLFNAYTSLIKSSGAGANVFALLDRVPPEPAISACIGREEDGETGLGVEVEVEGDEIEGTESAFGIGIRIENVSFSYPSRPDHEVLDGLNVDIAPGNTLAIVGVSGSGKSTVVNLLQRLYDPSTGSIFFNGKDLKGYDLTSLRRNIGVVTQDPVLFTGTIGSNIMYGKEHVSEEEVIRAAKLANAHNFIQTFQDGYDTQVGERGIQLSGGQKQRIAIARAIILKPSLLLLDEATSALDNESEKLVQEALENLLDCNNEMTTVVIAHRLQTIQNANKIVVLKDGRTYEEGSHKDLLLEGGLYHSMIYRASFDGHLTEEHR